MKTTTLELDDGQRAYVHHRSDWSGHVTISWVDDVSSGNVTSALVPGEIIRALMYKTAWNEALSTAISVLEDLQR